MKWSLQKGKKMNVSWPQNTKLSRSTLATSKALWPFVKGIAFWQALMAAAALVPNQRVQTQIYGERAREEVSEATTQNSCLNAEEGSLAAPDIFMLSNCDRLA